MRCMELFHLFLVVVSIHVLFLHSFLVNQKQKNWPELRKRLETETQSALQAHPFNVFLAELQRYHRNYQQSELLVKAVRDDGGIITDKFSGAISLQGIVLPEDRVYRTQSLVWLRKFMVGQKMLFQHFVPSGEVRPSGLLFRSEKVLAASEVAAVASVAEELLEMGLAMVNDDESLPPPLKASLDNFSLRGRANFRGMWGKNNK